MVHTDTTARTKQGLAPILSWREGGLPSKLVTVIVSNTFAIKLACIFYLYFFIGHFPCFGESSLLMCSEALKLQKSAAAKGLSGLGLAAIVLFLTLLRALCHTGKGAAPSGRKCRISLHGLFLVAAFFPNTAFTSPGCSVRTLPRGRAVPARPQGRGGGAQPGSMLVWPAPVQRISRLLPPISIKNNGDTKFRLDVLGYSITAGVNFAQKSGISHLGWVGSGAKRMLASWSLAESDQIAQWLGQSSAAPGGKRDPCPPPSPLQGDPGPTPHSHGGTRRNAPQRRGEEVTS